MGNGPELDRVWTGNGGDTRQAGDGSSLSDPTASPAGGPQGGQSRKEQGGASKRASPLQGTDLADPGPGQAFSLDAGIRGEP